jgi:hypothetical protein
MTTTTMPNPASAGIRADRRTATMARLARADAHARYTHQRRTAAAKAGYRGPLTRDEATVWQLANLNAAGYR